MIEFIRWSFRLRLATLGERLQDLAERSTVGLPRFGWSGPFVRFVDRVSPFSSDGGYARRRLRRLLFTLRYPRVALRRDVSWFVSEHIRVSLGVGPGRYQGLNWPDRLKAEWLDTNSEYADDSTGEIEGYGRWAALFDLTPPWSRGMETWLLSVDRYGFIDIASGVEGVDDFDVLQADYNRWLAFEEGGDPSDGGAAEVDWFANNVPLNVEGDPTRNGAFG